MRLSLSEGEIIVIARDEDGEWHHSEFPHPIVTLDYDKDNNLLQVTVAGHASK